MALSGNDHAAAGNCSVRRELWTSAMSHCIAVGCLESCDCWVAVLSSKGLAGVVACRLADASLLQAQKSTRKSTSQAPGKAPARAQIATRTSQRQSKNSTQTWLADQKTNHVLQKKHNLENYPSKKSTSKSQNEHQPFCPPEHQKKHQTSTKKKSTI